MHTGLGADRVGGGACFRARCGTVAPVTGRGILGPQSLPKPGTKAGFEEADLSAVCEKPVELTQRVPHLRGGASVGSVRMMIWVYLLPLHSISPVPRGASSRVAWRGPTPLLTLD